MAGKGGKGLLAAKTTAANRDKDKDKNKKTPVSKSSRAGIQVTPNPHLPFSFLFFSILLSTNFDGLLLLFSLNLRNLFGYLCFVHYLIMRECRVFSFYAISGNFFSI